VAPSITAAAPPTGLIASEQAEDVSVLHTTVTALRVSN
jgi:hypothetical protein